MENREKIINGKPFRLFEYKKLGDHYIQEVYFSKDNEMYVENKIVNSIKFSYATRCYAEGNLEVFETVFGILLENLINGCDDAFLVKKIKHCQYQIEKAEANFKRKSIEPADEKTKEGVYERIAVSIDKIKSSKTKDQIISFLDRIINCPYIENVPHLKYALQETIKNYQLEEKGNESEKVV